MSSQFHHISSYNIQASKKSKSTNNVKSILGEADRKVAYIKHLEAPEDPIILFGCALPEVEKMAENYRVENKIRKDGHVMLAGVISVRDDFPDWANYKEDCINDLKKTYGESLRSIVEHTDEVNPHIHYFCVPKNGEKFEDLHAGEKAKKEAARSGLLTTPQNIAYKKAMKLFQDNFFNNVSQKYGLSRFGSRLPRDTREVWKAKKEAVEIIANTKLERTNFINTTKSEAKDYILKSKIEAEKNKKEAEKKGFEAGLQEFEKQSTIEKMKAVYLSLNSSLSKQVDEAKQQVNSIKERANCQIKEMKEKIKDLVSELSTKEKDIKHISTLYDDVVKENRNMKHELKKPVELRFSEQNKDELTFKN